MTSAQVVAMATSQVGYHEKVTNTPVDDLYPFRNAYDGQDNWTKYLNDLNEPQGQPWCGFFAYWVFWQLLNKNFSNTDNFLHGISGKGGATSSWKLAFETVGQYHEGDGYTPKVGDVVLYWDPPGVPWSHVEIIVDVSGWPNTIMTVGGNTKNPEEAGLEDESMWVAKRTRYPGWTSGWRIRGYCETDLDNMPTMGSMVFIRRRFGTAFG